MYIHIHVHVYRNMHFKDVNKIHVGFSSLQKQKSKQNKQITCTFRII